MYFLKIENLNIQWQLIHNRSGAKLKIRIQYESKIQHAIN